MTAPLEFGLDTFGDVTRDASGAMLPHAQVIRNVVDEAVLADDLGLDFIGLGEHHRADFAISSPETALAAIAQPTVLGIGEPFEGPTLDVNQIGDIENLVQTRKITARPGGVTSCQDGDSSGGREGGRDRTRTNLPLPRRRGRAARTKRDQQR